MPSEPTEHEVVLKIYPGAYHDFDWEGMDEFYKGHGLLYDPDDNAQTIDQLSKNYKEKQICLADSFQEVSFRQFYCHLILI